MLPARIFIAAARKQTLTAFSCRGKHTLPSLPYDFKALEPVISRDIMEVHYTKHHQAYVNNLNIAEDNIKEALLENNVSKIISLGNAIKFNGGGHINHSIFWNNLTPNKTQPSNEFKLAIENRFQSIDNLKKEMATSTVAIQGSGWGWLGYNKKTGQLQLATCANQDPLQGTTGLIPIFGIDVWEHAYYLQYKNLRQNYVDAIFDIVNWEDLSKRYREAL